MTTTTFTDNRTITTNTQETTTVISSKDAFIFASEVSEKLCVSRAYGYRIVKKLNEELKEQGYLTIDGRTSRRYFDEKFYLKMW